MNKTKLATVGSVIGGERRLVWGSMQSRVRAVCWEDSGKAIQEGVQPPKGPW